MSETVERNNRFYTKENGEIITENEQLKEWLVVANKENERLNEENEELKKIQCTFLGTGCKVEIERLNNIINATLDFNLFKEECPLNLGYTEKCDEEKAQDVFYEDDYCEENCNDDYKKCWLKYFERLQELKGSNKENV